MRTLICVNAVWVRSLFIGKIWWSCTACQFLTRYWRLITLTFDFKHNLYQWKRLSIRKINKTDKIINLQNFLSWLLWKNPKLVFYFQNIRSLFNLSKKILLEYFFPVTKIMRYLNFSKNETHFLNKKVMNLKWFYWHPHSFVVHMVCLQTRHHFFEHWILKPQFHEKLNQVPPLNS